MVGRLGMLVILACSFSFSDDERVYEYVDFKSMEDAVWDRPILCVGEAVHNIKEFHELMAEIVGIATRKGFTNCIYIENDPYIYSVARGVRDTAESFEEYCSIVNKNTNRYITLFNKYLLNLFYYNKKLKVIGIDYTDASDFTSEIYHRHIKKRLTACNVDSNYMKMYCVLEDYLLYGSLNNLDTLHNAQRIVKRILSQIQDGQVRTLLKSLSVGLDIFIKMQNAEGNNKEWVLNARDRAMYQCFDENFSFEQRAIIIASNYHLSSNLEMFRKCSIMKEKLNIPKFGEYLRKNYRDSITFIGCLTGKIRMKSPNDTKKRYGSWCCQKKNPFNGLKHESYIKSKEYINKNISIRAYYYWEMHGQWMNYFDYFIFFPSVVQSKIYLPCDTLD